jgi:cytochrome P450
MNAENTSTIDAAIEQGCKNFDHHSPVHRAHTFEIYERLRQTNPVAHTDAWGGYWVLTRYEDVKRVAQDDVNFSAQKDGIVQPVTVTYPNPPIDLDPPLSTQVKRLLTPYFSPRAMERWIRDVEPLTSDLVDAFIETGHCDFTYDVGMPLTGIITMRMSGIDDGKWHDFADLVHKAIYFEGTVEQVVTYGDTLWKMCCEEVELQKRAPRPGVVSELLQATLNGEPVDEQMIRGVLLLFMFGGLDTTQAVIGSALVHLSRNPAMKRYLIDNPGALGSAVEEYLRMFSPQQALFRTVMNPVEIGGVQMKPGERVMMTWAAANRDPAEFADPKTFNPLRDPNRHMAFGIGSHRCLGSNLARIEIQSVLDAYLKRMPDFTVDESRLELARDVGTVYGYRHVPISFTPGKKAK